MRWVVTVEARNERDIERLLAPSAELAAGDSPKEAILEFKDDAEEATDESRHAIRTQVEPRSAT